MVDAADLKSAARKGVPVQVRWWAFLQVLFRGAWIGAAFKPLNARLHAVRCEVIAGVAKSSGTVVKKPRRGSGVICVGAVSQMVYNT